MNPIYLDYNATTPIDPEVASEMKPFLEVYFGNPSSIHQFGIQTKKAVEKARFQIADLINCKPTEIIFTSGGTEANNFALKGVAFANRYKGNHIITSTIEHPAITEVCAFLEKEGFIISYIPVDSFGRIKINELEKAISSKTILITVMHANNETGVIQPIEEIAEIAKSHGIIFHTDAAQSVGKIECDVQKLGVSLLSIAGHKLYAPKGIGALFIKEGIRLEKMIHGANHEQNLRAGTENVLEIVGLGKAAEIAKRDFYKNYIQLKDKRDKLQHLLQNGLENVSLNGHLEFRLPNTLNISFTGINNNTLLSELTEVAASAGAACHSDGKVSSAVLTAMNIPKEQIMGTIRLSTGKYTTDDEIEKAAKAIIEAVKRLQPGVSSINYFATSSEEIKLTKFTHGLGCACKIRPQYLEKVLQIFPLPNDKNVLVGLDKSDDATVYKISDDVAIVETLDFFTPIVDSPYYFGAIAAANALSDIYAMGAKPLFALNIVAFPEMRLPMEVLQQILKGASDKVNEAGISILGGHTVEDNEPKFGLAVTGIVHPSKVLTNSNAKKGDVLILTKPIGIGIISTAIKRNIAKESTIQFALETMSSLNKNAAEVMEKFPVNACTDITGFGLLGHLKEMCSGSKMNAEIYVENIPVINETRELIAANIIPGGTLNNLEFVKNHVFWNDTISQIDKILLADAQTSGGLLISLPSKYSDFLLKELHENNVSFAKIIGKIIGEGEGHIFVK